MSHSVWNRLSATIPLLRWVLTGSLDQANQIRLILRSSVDSLPTWQTRSISYTCPENLIKEIGISVGVESLKGELDPRARILRVQENPKDDGYSLNAIRAAQLLTLTEDDPDLLSWTSAIIQAAVDRRTQMDERFRLAIWSAQSMEDALIEQHRGDLPPFCDLNEAQRLKLLYLASGLGAVHWVNDIQKTFSQTRLEELLKRARMPLPWCAWLAWMNQSSLLSSWLSDHPVDTGAADWSEKFIHSVLIRLRFWQSSLGLPVGEQKWSQIEDSFLHCRGGNALLWAAFSEPAVSKILVKNGLDLNQMNTTSTHTPLSVAVSRHNWSLVRWLSEHGASALLPKESNNTLHYLMKQVVSTEEAKLAVREVFSASQNRIDPTTQLWTSVYAQAFENVESSFQLECLMQPVNTRWSMGLVLDVQKGGRSLISHAFKPGYQSHLEKLAGHGVGVHDFLEHRADNKSRLGRIGFALACWAPSALAAWLDVARPDELMVLSSDRARHAPTSNTYSEACRTIWFGFENSLQNPPAWHEDDNIWFAALRGKDPLTAIRALVRHPQLVSTIHERIKVAGVGMSPLEYALQSSHCNGVVETILRASPNPNWTQEKSANLLATWTSVPRFEQEIERVGFEKLLNFNVSIDEDHNNLLHLSIQNHDAWLMRFALNAGVSEQQKNSQFKSPLDMLHSAKNWEEGHQVWSAYCRDKLREALPESEKESGVTRQRL